MRTVDQLVSLELSRTGLSLLLVLLHDHMLRLYTQRACWVLIWMSVQNQHEPLQKRLQTMQDSKMKPVHVALQHMPKRLSKQITLGSLLEAVCRRGPAHHKALLADIKGLVVHAHVSWTCCYYLATHTHTVSW